MKKKEEFFEHFDDKKYQAFIKKAFQKSDAIEIYINKSVIDISELSVGKNAFIGNNMIGVRNIDKYEHSSSSSYAIVEMNKNYEVFEALQHIASWEDFYGEDEKSDYHIIGLEFLKDGAKVAYIWSHYVGYYSEFGWY